MQVSRPKINITTQYYVQRGYKLISFDVDSTGAILTYVNTKPVICEATGIDNNGIYGYTNFGIPQESSEEVQQEVQQVDDYHVFEPNEHILLVPIPDPSTDGVQYLTIDGYELVGVTYYEFGWFALYGGSWAVYTNNAPVKCMGVDGEYLEFGEPVEETKVLVK